MEKLPNKQVNFRSKEQVYTLTQVVKTYVRQIVQITNSLMLLIFGLFNAVKTLLNKCSS